MEQLLTSPGFTPLCSGIVIQETHLVSTWTQKIRASRIATPLVEHRKWLLSTKKPEFPNDSCLIMVLEDESYGKMTDLRVKVCEGLVGCGGYISAANGEYGFDTLNDWDEGQPICVTHWMPFPQPCEISKENMVNMLKDTPNYCKLKERKSNSTK